MAPATRLDGAGAERSRQICLFVPWCREVGVALDEVVVVVEVGLEGTVEDCRMMVVSADGVWESVESGDVLIDGEGMPLRGI